MHKEHLLMMDHIASVLAKHDELADALAASVPKKDYERVLTALKRCQELLAVGAVYVTNANAALEMRTYASALSGYFEDMGNYPAAYFNISDGYDPAEYLKGKGVIQDDGRDR